VESENILKLGCLPAVGSRNLHSNHCADCMTISYYSNNEPGTSGRLRVRLTKPFKAGAIVTMFLFLIAGNVLSLTHQASHDAGFRIIQSILGWVTPKKVAEAWLSRSPTIIRDKQIADATRELKEERDAIAEKHRKLNTDYKALGDDHKKLEGDHRSLSAAHTQLQQQGKQRAAMVDTVVQRVGARQARSAARNVASAPGKTIPVVGAALIAGATAWDIYEACELLNDLDQLATAFGNSSARIQRQKVCGLPVPTQAGLLQRAQANWRGVYDEAAKELQGLPHVPIPTVPQVPSWSDVKRSVCAVTGAVPHICP